MNTKARALSFIVAVTIVATVVFFGGKIRTGKESITKAKVSRAIDLIRACGGPKSGLSGEGCLNEYANKHNLVLDGLIRDGYGEVMIFEADTCGVPSHCLPYSKGADKIDDCGKGDDVFMCKAP